MQIEDVKDNLSIVLTLSDPTRCPFAYLDQCKSEAVAENLQLSHLGRKVLPRHHLIALLLHITHFELISPFFQLSQKEKQHVVPGNEEEPSQNGRNREICLKNPHTSHSYKMLNLYMR